MGGMNGNPAAAPMQTPDEDFAPQKYDANGTPIPGSPMTSPDKTANPRLDAAKAALLGLFKGYKAPDAPQGAPGGQPVQQVQINPNQGGQVAAPSSQGNYPTSSLAKRNFFGGGN